MTIQPKPDKGGYMEELLRNYFYELGYFVVRGIKFKYQEFDITDVDLWLYSRPSTITRERINVDIKNKKIPQAIERIFWTKGLQMVLGLDKCIVATNDNRPAVIEFGHTHNVVVLDGYFLSKLSKYKSPIERLSEEEFVALIQSDNLSELKGNWRKRLDFSKSLLISQMNFSGCNFWLAETEEYIKASIVDHARNEIACRLFYLHLSYFLIGLDFIFKELSFIETSERGSVLRDGLQHGSLGKMGVEKIINTSIQLIEQYTPRGKELSTQIRRNLSAAFEQIQVDILKEYFNRPDVVKSLFVNARKLELLAYLRHFTSPSKIENELQGLIGVILDFFQIERRQFFDAFSENPAPPADQQNVNNNKN